MVKQFKKSPELSANESVYYKLSILNTDDCTGYEIMKQLKIMPGVSFTWKEGNLYPVIKRLEQIKYIQYYWDRKNSKRPRKVYRITVRGRKALDGDLNYNYIRLNTLFRLWKKMPHSI